MKRRRLNTCNAADQTRLKQPPKRPRMECKMDKIGDDCMSLIICFLSHRDVCRTKAVRRCFGPICRDAFKKIVSISSKIKGNEIPPTHFTGVVISNFYRIREIRVYPPVALSFSEIKTVVEVCPLLEDIVLRFLIECPHKSTCQPGVVDCQDFLLTYLAANKPNLKVLILAGCLDPEDVQNYAISRPSLSGLQFYFGSGDFFHSHADVLLNAVAELVRNTDLNYLTLCMDGLVSYCRLSDFWKQLRRFHILDYTRGLFLNLPFWRTPAMEIFKWTTWDYVRWKRLRYVCNANDNFKMTMYDELEYW